MPDRKMVNMSIKTTFYDNTREISMRRDTDYIEINSNQISMIFIHNMIKKKMKKIKNKLFKLHKNENYHFAKLFTRYKNEIFLEVYIELISIDLPHYQFKFFC